MSGQSVGLEPGMSGSQGKRPNHWATLPPPSSNKLIRNASNTTLSRLVLQLIITEVISTATRCVSAPLLYISMALMLMSL